jgi:hypothetical protein
MIQLGGSDHPGKRITIGTYRELMQIKNRCTQPCVVQAQSNGNMKLARTLPLGMSRFLVPKAALAGFRVAPSTKTEAKELLAPYTYTKSH